MVESVNLRSLRNRFRLARLAEKLSNFGRRGELLRRYLYQVPAHLRHEYPPCGALGFPGTVGQTEVDDGFESALERIVPEPTHLSREESGIAFVVVET